MEFEEVLQQTIALLQRQGRTSYRALKRRFGIDDDFLEDVKEELIYARQLATEEGGRALVWSGAASESPASPYAHQTPMHAAGERRQVTIVFADISGFTALSEQMDAETIRSLMNTCFAHLVPIIECYGGTIDKFLGDAIMALFGAPIAHDNDAERAVRAALEMMEALSTFNAEHGTDLGLHCGINTGMVIAGNLGTASKQEYSVLGDAVNLAARLEDVSARGEIFVGPETYRLTAALLTYEALGPRAMKGKAEPVEIYRATGLRGVQGRLEGVKQGDLTQFVGREAELTKLLDHWHRTTQGSGCVILLSGEAGIGKSRLLQTLKARVVRGLHTRFECRCSPYHQHSAFYALIDLWQRQLQWHPREDAASRLDKLERLLESYTLPLTETVPLMAALLALEVPEDRYGPLTLSPRQQRRRTMEVLLLILQEIATQRPILFVMEDLHWADPSTLEFLQLVIDQAPMVSMLILLTYRPTFQPPWPPSPYMTPVVLHALQPAQVENMIGTLAEPHHLPATIVEQIMAKAEGVPLFVEELTKTVIELADTKAWGQGDTPISPSLPLDFDIPSTLQESLMARLDRLASVRVVAQIGATIGRQFTYELIHAVACMTEAELKGGLQRLVEAELIYQQGMPPKSTYLFKHALVQDVAYGSLLKHTRQQYHRRIASVLESQFPEIKMNEPELLAHHYTEVGLAVQAVPYWQLAGKMANTRSAHKEAIAHLTKGLEALEALPKTPERLQQELDLLVLLGPALRATQGNGSLDTERVYARARELCEQIGDNWQLFSVLQGLMGYYQVRGEVQTSCRLAEQLLSLAESHAEPEYLLIAHYQLGQSLCFRGELSLAWTHLTQAISIYDAQAHPWLSLRYGRDAGVSAYPWLARALWQLGYPDQALRHGQEAIRLAEKASSPYNVAFVLLWLAGVHQLRREARAAYEQAEAAIALSREQGFVQWLARATIVRGWALAMQGQSEAGMAEMRQGLDAERATGAVVQQSYFLGLLAEAHGEGEHPEQGLQALAEAMASVATTEVRYYEAELHRLKGMLLLRQSMAHADRAEACFHQALDVARAQQAKSWELRAAMDLAKLWRGQGKREEARELLAPVYHWFSEGFDTADLKDAKALLEALAPPRLQVNPESAQSLPESSRDRR